MDKSAEPREGTPLLHKHKIKIETTDKTSPQKTQAVMVVENGDTKGLDGTEVEFKNGKYGATNGKGAENGTVAAEDKVNEKDKEKEEEKPQVPFTRLFRYATGLDGLFMFIGCFAAGVHGCAWPVLNIVFGGLIDQFVDFDKLNITNLTAIPVDATLPPGLDPGKEFDDTMQEYAVIFSYIGVGVMVFAYLQTSMWTLACERQIYKIRQAFFDAILHQEIQWFDVHKSGELTSRLADDMERVKEGIGDKIALCIQYLFLFLAGFGIAFWKSWEMTLVLLSMTPLLAAAGGFMAYFLTSFSKLEQESYAQAGSVAEEVLSCVRTVIAFGGEQKEVTRYEKELKGARDVGVKKGVASGVGMGITMLIMFGSYSLAFWYGPKLVADGRLTGGDVMIVFFCVMIGSFSIGNISPSMTAITAARGAAVTLFDIIDATPEIDTRSKKGVRPDKMTGNIEFKGVEFSYPTRADVPVLRGVDLSIRKGQTVALVGSSGCGKSTTINLLLRFYEKLGGQILIDGNKIEDLNLRWLREHIGVVSQEPILFNCSIETNISYGRDGVTKDEIIQAAKMANAHDFISKLPKGYDTMVGERGAQLSGGQKQRVAIARALVRNPPILLLDEATSALDRESEKVVQQALDKASEGRTTIVIAHRLTTIRNADIIYAFEEGQIAEYGDHAELMKRDGVYKQLVTLQTLDGAEESATSSKETVRKESIKRLPSRQMSRQISRQMSTSSAMEGKDKEEEEIVEEEVESRGYLEILKLNSPEWYYIVIGCIFAGALGVAMPAFAILFSEVIAIFSLPPDEMRDESVFWALMFLALGGAFFVSNSITGICFSISGEELTLRLRKKAFWTILRQDCAYFDQPSHSTGALATRLSSDASNVKGATGMRISTIVQSMVTLIVALVIGFIFGWKLALLIFGCLPVLAISGALEMKILQGGHEKDAALIEEAGKIAAEAIENVRTVASLNLEDRMISNYAEQLENPYKQGKINSQVNGLAFAVSQAMIFFIYAASFRLGGYLVSIGDMTGDEVFKVIFGVAFAGISVGQSMAFLPDYAKARHSADLILHLFNTKPLIDNYSTDGAHPSSVQGRIEYSGLKFAYPTRPDITILKGLSLTIKPGQTVALVGESGCGKSTLVSLLERFYDPEQGTVSLDGKYVKDINIQWLRANMAIVSQEPILFACSIGDNIRYGVDEKMEVADIEKVAKMANIHDFIASLPLGYDTLVGEKGTQLSGGQKQRVAIARALARNPRILLLDEATSALDTESEKVVQAALDNAMKDRTSIVIAHRLSTIQNADVIAVIREGVVVESGSHQELLQSKGHYYTLTGGKIDVE
ncbi:ATP-dependent translocase ABCB1-like [Lytechinus pictus]|uniref:ATP-dependent translocase ABCB1-like n=1 Tax=Lytechinus pictus TaxID=7653 RepID=UPI0030BA0602